MTVRIRSAFGVLLGFTIILLFINMEQLVATRRLAKQLLNTRQMAHLSRDTTVIVTTSIMSSNDQIKPDCPMLRENMTYLKTPSLLWNNTCDKSSCFQSSVRWTMVIFVKSAATNFKRREAIRRSWGMLRYINGGRFYTIFIVRQTSENLSQSEIDSEAEMYGDILQIAMPESYRNIPFKTLAGMQWSSENLPENYLYSSADDDVLIDFEMVQKVVDANYGRKAKKQIWQEYPIICMYKVVRESKPIRNKSSKYFVSKEEYKWPDYPQYCLGGMYSTSVSVVRQLFQVSLQQTPLRMDDVWITGILRQQINMPNEMVIFPKEPTVKRLSTSGENFAENDSGNVWENTLRQRTSLKKICLCEYVQRRT
ncbi:beta-1,3-galactosyltransferase 5-like isoform X2 [Clavelina lepadiformis]|uniref:beta-1,3-galactosyltransferase 5-like isoform X2 n=1 Tax=Clavelina lepadiformis TaxID=159417 RepID=UPI0040422690